MRGAARRWCWSPPASPRWVVCPRARRRCLGAKAPAEPVGIHSAVIGGTLRDLPVWGFGELAPDQRVPGPAIVESDTTTVLLLERDEARLDGRGWLEVGVG